MHDIEGWNFGTPFDFDWSRLIEPPAANNDLAVITRFIRANEVQFVGQSLCPDKQAVFFFDSQKVDTFCQKSNRIELTPASFSGTFYTGEGVVDSNTNYYASVLSTSNNIIYLNQNYININVAVYGANSLASVDYTADDVVYQTDTGIANGTVTFQGKVAYYNHSNAVMAIIPQTGKINAASNVASVILKKNGTNLSNAASIIRGNIYNVNSNCKIYSSSNVSTTGNVSAYEHYAGTFTSANGANTITIMSQANTALAVGNVITITSGTGIGEKRTISAVTSNNELVLNAAITSISSNSMYSYGPHVIDEFGKISGIFHIPELPNYNFQTGLRTFTITDNQAISNTDYLMRATATYGVEGRPPDIIVRPPPPPPVAIRKDPIAQTFFTPKTNTLVGTSAKPNYGIYVSSVDLFFAEKPILVDLQLPVTVEIVEVENGIPTQKILGVAVVEAKNVNVSLVPDVANTSTITNFKFGDPVYLRADAEYAIIVKSDSPDYNVFICELGGEILGAVPPRRVSQQPYLGSFFKSQNASTWTPIQNQDLMFQIRKCIFTETTATVLFKPSNQLANVNIDSLIVHTLDLNHKPTKTSYKIRSNNVTNVQDAEFTFIPSNALHRFGSDLLTSIKSSNRRRVLVAGDSLSMNVGVELTSTDYDVSPLLNFERLSMIALENKINDASISASDISITSHGVSHKNASNIVLTFSAPDLADGVQATASVTTLTSNVITLITMTEPGSGYITTPTITIVEPLATTNATAIIAGETSFTGGNCLTRYITKMITLADRFDAGDLDVFLDCIRPRGTNIHVYYKVKAASDGENFTEKKWKLMEKVIDSYSIDQNQVIEIKFKPSLTKNILSYVEGGTTYPLGGKFKYFAIKIVLTAGDTTVVPAVKNLRAIATPSG